MIIDVLSVTYNDDGSPNNIDKKQWVDRSFLMSIRNDTKWVPVVANPVNRCYNEYSVSDDGFYCEIVPFDFLTIIDQPKLS